jgi:hypothetical protein
MSDRAGIVEIEAFRAGGKASRGITATELDEAIASYKGDTDPAPLVFGHPESNDPAHGVIATLRREGNKLIAGLKDISADAIAGVRENRFLNRSIAFWHPDHSANPTPGKWNIRHLGLLGAASPGIPGMSKLSFSADEHTIEATDAPDTAVIFAEEPTKTVTVHTKGGPKVADQDTVAKTEYDAIVAERDRLQAEAATAATARETARKDANTAFVADLIKQGRVTPGDKVLFTEILNKLPVEEVQFDAERKGDLAAELKRALSTAEPRVIFSEVSPKGERGNNGKTLSAAEITAKAQQLVKDGKAVSFEAAVEAIETQQGA